MSVSGRVRKALLDNTTQRDKFPDDPSQFVDSELELSIALQACRDIAPNIQPQEEDQLLSVLVEALTHPNTDITALAVQALLDILQTKHRIEVCHRSLKAFQLLIQTLGTLNQQAHEDLETFDNILAIIENAVDIAPDPLAIDLLQDKLLLQNLLAKMMAAIEEQVAAGGGDEEEDEQKQFDQLALYCSEILAIVLQASQASHPEKVKEIVQKHVTLVPQLLSISRYYSKQDPKSKEETEFAANVMNSLCEVLLENVNTSLIFQKAGGFAVCLDLMRKKTFGRTFGLKLLSVSLFDCPENCAELVSIGGLKTLFGCLMFPVKTSKKYENNVEEEEECIAYCLAHLFMNLSNLNYRRLLKKFRESDFQKVKKIVSLHGKYFTSSRNEDVDDEDESISYVLQGTSMILAFLLSAEDEKLAKAVVSEMDKQNLSVGEITSTLQENLESMEDSNKKVVISNLLGLLSK